MATPLQITERDKELYRILCRLAKERAVTPTNAELAEMLTAAGHPTPKRTIWEIAGRLTKAKFIEFLDGNSLLRARYCICGVGPRIYTMSRGEAQEIRRQEAVTRLGTSVGDRDGWPIPTAASAAAYDAAMRRRVYADRREEPQTRVHRTVSAAFQARSYTTCTAWECAV